MGSLPNNGSAPERVATPGDACARRAGTNHGTRYPGRKSLYRGVGRGADHVTTTSTDRPGASFLHQAGGYCTGEYPWKDALPQSIDAPRDRGVALSGRGTDRCADSPKAGPEFWHRQLVCKVYLWQIERLFTHRCYSRCYRAASPLAPDFSSFTTPLTFSTLLQGTRENHASL